jgi:hypothetical protein
MNTRNLAGLKLARRLWQVARRLALTARGCRPKVPRRRTTARRRPRRCRRPSDRVARRAFRAQQARPGPRHRQLTLPQMKRFTAQAAVEVYLVERSACPPST